VFLDRGADGRRAIGRRPLPVTEPTGSMVVDIGGGTTEVAVLSLGGIVLCPLGARSAATKMDEAIIAYIRRLHKPAGRRRLGRAQSRRRSGSACPPEDGEGRIMEIKGSRF